MRIYEHPIMGPVARAQLTGELHERSFLLAELESLGISPHLLNEINDISELHGLVRLIKESLMEEYRRWDRSDAERTLISPLWQRSSSA